MANITEIIKNDIRTIYKNPIVMLILLVVIILPSLYAVLNVDACWDMYGNTGELGFAIANLDNGSSYNGEKINVGTFIGIIFNEINKSFHKTTQELCAYKIKFSFSSDAGILNYLNGKTMSMGAENFDN